MNSFSLMENVTEWFIEVWFCNIADVKLCFCVCGPYSFCFIAISSGGISLLSCSEMSPTKTSSERIGSECQRAVIQSENDPKVYNLPF